MLTKTGSELLIKEADAVIGPIIGAVRAGRLSSAERKKLKEHYGLADDASLGWRNAGRGVLGGALGGLAGGAAGAATYNPVLARLLAAAGGLSGAFLATNKYSKGNSTLEGD